MAIWDTKFLLLVLKMFHLFSALTHEIVSTLEEKISYLHMAIYM